MRGHTGNRLILALGFLAFSATASLAAQLPDNSHLGSPMMYPGAPKPVNDEPKSPYAMSYSDEVAQSLGVKNGHMDVFSSQPADDSYLPAVSGGLGGDGAMLKLQWHPGN